MGLAGSVILEEVSVILEEVSRELNNDTSKIIEIHCKKLCFGLRRLQDGAKMDPNNALFWSVKILRIHCKQWGLGRMSVIQKIDNF